MDLQQKIRKNQSQMVVSANMLRFFGCWSFFKLFLYFTLSSVSVGEALQKSSSFIHNHPELILAGEISALIMAGFYTLLNLYAAKCAIDEAKKNKKHKAFLVLIFFILIVTVIDLVLFLNTDYWLSFGDTVVSLLTDTANLIVVVQLIYSTMFFRKHKIELN